MWKWICSIVRELQVRVVRLRRVMKATLKYLTGFAGPSGYGSKTTAEQVAQDCFFFSDTTPFNHLTAIVTGK